MAKQLKTLMRSEEERRFKDIDGGVVVSYRGINTENVYNLRKALLAKGAKLHIVKNAIAIRAFQSLGYEEKKLTKIFDGPVGVLYSHQGKGVIAAIKALKDWKKDSKDKFIEVKGGFLKGDILAPADIKALENLPSREQLLGMVAGAFQAPIAAFANRLYECQAKFAYAINAVKEQKEKAEKSAK